MPLTPALGQSQIILYAKSTPRQEQTRSGLDQPESIPTIHSRGTRNVPLLAPIAQRQVLREWDPVYPSRELQRRIGGTTIVAFSYDADGKVVSASVKSSSGNKSLDNAAVTAVKQWTVASPVKDGQPMAGESESPVTFSP